MKTSNINKNVDIFIYSHIPFTPLVTNPVYKILTNNNADDSEFHTNLPIYRDYTGDNISDKNLIFNEYSGFYWLLNNWDLKDYTGMIHYRRYFNFMDDVPNINEIFKKHRIILNEKFPLQYNGQLMNNKDFYKIWHNESDFNLMEKIVKDMYPEYSDGWDKMAQSSHIYPSSLFIMKKDMLEEYLTFAFDCMDTFNDERNCHTKDEWINYVTEHQDEYIRPQHKYYDIKMQSRATGYLVERCLAAFLMHNGNKSLENNSLQVKWTLTR